MSGKTFWRSTVAPLAVAVTFSGLFSGRFAVVATAQAPQTSPAAQPGNSELQVTRIDGFDRTSVYMIIGAGGNITMQVGDDGILLVDTGLQAASDKVLAAIRQVSSKPVKFIINTHAHGDHVGGNDAVVKAYGGLLIQGNGAQQIAGPEINGNVVIVSHQETQDRMSEPSGDRPAYPTQALPIETFLSQRKDLYFNGEPIELWWIPAAHTDGDVIVHFRRSDVVSAGDLLVTDTFPMFDVQSGGAFQGVLDGLNRVIAMAIPRFNQMDGTHVIPGHGRVCDEADVAEFREMGTIVRDRIQHMVDKKMTLAQVKAARPLIDYDPVYGAKTGFWATDGFLEAVYKDLGRPRTGPLPKSGLNFGDGGQ